MEDTKKITDMDFEQAVPPEMKMTYRKQSQVEMDLTDFAIENRDLTTKKSVQFKNQSVMSQAYDDAQKYDPDQIIEIIYGVDSAAKADLSKYYFEISSIYRVLILYFATILTYDFIVVPRYDNIPTKSPNKRNKLYRAALDYCDMMNVPILMMDALFIVLRDGVYYGLLRTAEEGVTMQTVPRDWCRVASKDIYGGYSFDIDLQRFSRIYNDEEREAILKGFPKNVQKGYNQYIRSNRDPALRWFNITSEQGLCLFSSESLAPMFVPAIEDIVAFKETKTIENERALEELSKIIVHKLPLDNEKQPIFTINEAKALHRGFVEMFIDNKYVDIITSFGEVSVENIQSAGVVQNQHLTNMASAIYNSLGISKEIFSADKNTGLKYSVEKDAAIAYSIIKRAETWLMHQVNLAMQVGFNMKKYARFFEVSILFLSHYNREDYIKIYKDLASSGYSKILPYVAAGIPQSALEDLITLEEDLGLVDRMVPLQSSYTQTGEDEAGKPPLAEEDQDSKTIENKNADDGEGGVNE